MSDNDKKPLLLTFCVFWSEEDNEWAGICNEFPRISHLATSKIDALEGILGLTGECINDLRLYDKPMPWDVP